MELKQRTPLFFRYNDRLLIVPYGIETNVYHWLMKKAVTLLIVPYGIETPGVTALLKSLPIF